MPNTIARGDVLTHDGELYFVTHVTPQKEKGRVDVTLVSVEEIRRRRDSLDELLGDRADNAILPDMPH